MWQKVRLHYGRRGIAPSRNCTNIFKNVINLFVCIKLIFFSFTISFLYLIYSLGGYKMNKTHDHEFNFKKMGAIPCGCNTKWTLHYIMKYTLVMTNIFVGCKNLLNEKKNFMKGDNILSFWTRWVIKNISSSKTLTEKQRDC